MTPKSTTSVSRPSFSISVFDKGKILAFGIQGSDKNNSLGHNIL